MEGLSPLNPRVAGIDVHRMLHVVTVLIENEDGTITKHQNSFGGFKRDMRAMVFWLLELQVGLVVMESTGIYWKSAYSHLERAGIPAMVVNAHFIKHVPGRKTDMCDSEWLAVLARFGLVRGSFIPPKDLRELRLISRYRRKLSGMLAGETNRLHKVLDDGGIKLGAVVSDINGVSAREMVAGLVNGKTIDDMLDMARGSLKNKRDDLQASLDGDLSARHLFILFELHEHIKALEQKLAKIDAYLLDAMKPYQWAFELLQTIPGIDAVSSAMILIEIGDDMSHKVMPNSWLPGLHYVLATMNRQASGNRGKPVKVMPSSVIFYVNVPMRHATPKVPWRPNTGALRFVRVIKNVLLLLHTS